MRRVFSSFVESVHYDASDLSLTVNYKDGGSSVYVGVPPTVGRAVESAPSIGEALHEQIRGRYAHQSTKARKG